MGMFDSIMVDGKEFQTKDLSCDLQKYIYDKEKHTFTLGDKTLTFRELLESTGTLRNDESMNYICCYHYDSDSNNDHPADIILYFFPEIEDSYGQLRYENKKLKFSFEVVFPLNEIIRFSNMKTLTFEPNTDTYSYICHSITKGSEGHTKYPKDMFNFVYRNKETISEETQEDNISLISPFGNPSTMPEDPRRTLSKVLFGPEVASALEVNDEFFERTGEFKSEHDYMLSLIQYNSAKHYADGELLDKMYDHLKARIKATHQLNKNLGEKHDICNS